MRTFTIDGNMYMKTEVIFSINCSYDYFYISANKTKTCSLHLYDIEALF